MKLLIKAKDIYVEYSGKTILDIKDLEVFDYDRIGIVGSNGSGKSTLIKILLKQLTPQEGTVDLYGDFQYISQLTSSKVDVIEELSRLSHFDVLEESIQLMSGGESTRLKIGEALSKVGVGIIADEPTSFLDAEGVDLLINEFKYFPGAIITASHDRYFLDELVNQIWEIRDGELRVYSGNYSAYRRIKDAKVERDNVEFEQYVSKKKALEKSIQIKRNQAEKVSRNNKRNRRKNNTKDGGRLSMQKDSGTKEKKLYRQASSLKKDLERLELVTQKKEQSTFVLRHPGFIEINNAYPISVRNLSKSYNDKVIFDDVSFDIPLGSKVALVGCNGSGKTTLFKMIMNREEGVSVASQVKIGFFSQDSFIAKNDMSVFDYMNKESGHNESNLRRMLASTGFFQEDIHKKISVLSGGELVKLRLCKLMSETYNVLILDEPTNFLDLDSIEVIEQMIQDFEGTVIFSSHDQQLVKFASDFTLNIIEGKIEMLV